MVNSVHFKVKGRRSSLVNSLSTSVADDPSTFLFSQGILTNAGRVNNEKETLVAVAAAWKYTGNFSIHTCSGVRVGCNNQSCNQDQ